MRPRASEQKLASPLEVPQAITRLRFGKTHTEQGSATSTSTWHCWRGRRDPTHEGPPGSKWALVSAWRAVWVSTQTQNDATAGPPSWNKQQKCLTVWASVKTLSSHPYCWTFQTPSQSATKSCRAMQAGVGPGRTVLPCGVQSAMQPRRGSTVRGWGGHVLPANASWRVSGDLSHRFGHWLQTRRTAINL